MTSPLSFLPLVLPSVRAELARGTPAELAARVTDAARRELSPAERGKLAQVLQLTATQLAV